ncbi:hypothetical protein M752DRAFT_336583 [Aspergillus phoenicis ATCC 13157]|uniref:Uncharacterized protein n=1 Tax=Aspergillus phoenicis ATCC 13157 TaxID=1353007 RepID=A0A370PGQ9_ASPPH|nr:hypothetical protein M752DRAFT_336583 [Aspergillus phoenicis ATCC 13157]
MAYIGDAAVIFFVILGCVMVTLSGYSTHYLMTNGFYGLERDIDPTAEQRVRLFEGYVSYYYRSDGSLGYDLEHGMAFGAWNIYVD